MYEVILSSLRLGWRAECNFEIKLNILQSKENKLGSITNDFYITNELLSPNMSASQPD